MKPVEPRDSDLTYFRKFPIAEHQPQYLTLPALVDTRPVLPGSDAKGAVVSVWEPTDYEMELLTAAVFEYQRVEGKPRPKFTLTLWTFGQNLQPIMLVVGERSEAWAVRDGEPESLAG
jgi:hypothetical protein